MNTHCERTRDARFAFEELRMSRYMSGVRLLPGALLAVLGWTSPGWATYGGGACNRCAPAPVVQTTTVVLAPQCQTVNQTVYETVYENQPFTAMETRYRTGYKT